MNRQQRRTKAATQRSMTKSRSPDPHRSAGATEDVAATTSSLAVSPSESAAGADDRGPGRSSVDPGSTNHQEKFTTMNEDFTTMDKICTNNEITSQSESQPEPVEIEADRDRTYEADESLPAIDRVPIDGLRVGAGGTLVVPREDIGDEIDDSTELDLAEMMPQKVRKPGRREWIALNPASKMTTHLLLHKPKADGFDVEHHFIDKRLRPAIREELKGVEIFVYYSFTMRAHALWIINVTPENSWYESIASLLKQPSEFFDKFAIRVISDKPNSRYRVKYKPLPGPVAWPNKSTGQLLGEAFGPSRFITRPDHPIYVDLVEGLELG
jgi:hypothetical protein